MRKKFISKKGIKRMLAGSFVFPLLATSAIGVNHSVCKAMNPIVQTIFTTDPAPMVYDGALYVYTGHDEDNADYYDMRDWRCYKTTDMQNWTDMGCVASCKTFSWCDKDAWAAQCIERNGKFYLYVPVASRNGATAIGVAVADSPEGPFHDAIGKPLIQFGGGNIDPTVFIDQDGQAYLYWGNPALKYVKLNKNMTSYSGDVQTVPLTAQGFGANGNRTKYVEGPWFYRRGNLYYMIYAASGIPENICYSTSNSPTGPWTFRGEIMPTGGGSFTNHPGIVDFKGHSYFFYHNGQLPGGNGFQRSVAVEEFHYNPDGSIPRIDMTKNGPSQLQYLNPYVRNEAETICWESGVETEPCGEGTQNVGFIDNGDYIMLKGVDFGSGAASFEARVASATNGGAIEIRLDSLDGKLAGTCSVEGTGAWQTYTTKTCNISGATGKHDVYFKFTGGSGSLFNFNWWKFISKNGEVVPSTQPSEQPQPSKDITVGFEEGKVEDGLYTLKSVDSGKYLQVKDNKGENAQNVEIGTGTGIDGQKWYVVNQEDGTITLKSALGDYNLDIGLNENKDGANAQIYSAWNGQSQKYKLQKTMDSKTFIMRTATSDYTKALDVSALGKEDGTNVCQWSYNGDTNQQWVFERVDTPSVSVSPSTKPSTEPSQEPTPSQITPTPTQAHSEDISYEYSVISDWGNGCQGQVQITNNTSKSYNGWTLTFDYSNKIASLWGADLVGQTGTKVTIKNPSWDNTLAPGASVTINFIAEGSSDKKPFNYAFN